MDFNDLGRADVASSHALLLFLFVFGRCVFQLLFQYQQFSYSLVHWILFVKKCFNFGFENGVESLTWVLMLGFQRQ